MNSKLVWAGALVVVCAGAAAWLLRGAVPGSGSDPGVASRPDRLIDRSGLAHAKPLPAPAPGVRQDALRQEAAQETRVAARSSAPRESPGAALPRGREFDFVARLFAPPGPTSTPAERQAWEQSPIQDLLYPEGHPCAGQLVDSVSRSVLTAAGNETLMQHIGSIPDLDRPQCRLQGQWPFHPLNQCARGLDREDPASVEAFMSCLAGIGQDPKAYPADIWVPCAAGDPRATTMRAHFQDLVAGKVDEMLSAPRCQS